MRQPIKKIIVSLAVPFSCNIHSALAQATSDSAAHEPTLPTVVVTASRAPRTLGEEIADISVIPREEIERAGQQTVADLLQQQPGIELGRNGGAGAATSIFMRGANSSQVVVLVDGVRINSPSFLGISWQALPLAQVERIEILRGPASGLYGADAIGGVIQIFTRQGKSGFNGEIAAGVGSYGLNNQSVNLRGGSEAVRYAVTVGQEAARGFSAKTRLVADRDNDGYQSKNAGANLDLLFNKDHSLGLQMMQSRLVSQFDSGAAFDNRAVQYAEVYALTSKNRLQPNWQSTLRLAESRDKYSDIADYGFGSGTSRLNTRQEQALWQNDLTLGTDDLLQLSLEKRREVVDTDQGYTNTERQTRSSTVLYQWNRGDHSVQANLRNDDSNQFGSRDTGGLGYGYRITPHWRVTASAATAFRAPTFTDLYDPYSGNPALLPETAKSYETGLQYRRGNDEFAIGAYRNRVHNLIVYDGGCGCMTNVGNASLEGINLRGATKLGAWLLSSSFDFQNPNNVETGKLLQRRAREHGAVKALYQTEKTSAGAEWLLSSARFDDAANNNRMGGYGLLNLLASYRVDQDLEVLVRWNNVFDKKYELAQDYQTAGANGFVGLRYQFGGR
ncbi:MAG: TonB-dependent receptor [Burkholderiaceae bacterium]|nr:MAG: TonB-dependent receptor [Burkholderiaceae bacterium]